MREHLPRGRQQSGRVQAQVREQFVPLAMLDEPVRDPKSSDLFSRQTGLVRGFEHGGAEAAIEGAFFDRDHKACLLESAENRVGIQRTQEPGIDHADVKTLFAELFGRFETTRQECSKCDKSSVRSRVEHLRPA